MERNHLFRKCIGEKQDPVVLDYKVKTGGMLKAFTPSDVILREPEGNNPEKQRTSFSTIHVDVIKGIILYCRKEGLWERKIPLGFLYSLREIQSDEIADFELDPSLEWNDFLVAIEKLTEVGFFKLESEEILVMQPKFLLWLSENTFSHGDVIADFSQGPAY
jgi:hypothetical protein